MTDSRDQQAAKRRWWVIPASLALALFFTVLPYPQWMEFARPDWVTLALFYWCLAAPRRVGVGCGWAMGLLLDVMHYTLFGQHAIGKALIALIAVGNHQQLRLYPLWQQSAALLLIACLDTAILVWIHHLVNDIEIRLVYWQSAVTTALLWPALRVVLRRAGR